MKRTLFGDFSVEVDDGACEKNLWRERSRHPDTLKFLHKRLSKMDSPVFLDVGAGLGRYALLAKFVLGMRAICWEPNPAVFGYLENNVRLNGLGGRVSVFNCGLWHEAGFRTLRVPRLVWRFRSATMGNHPHKREWKSVEVPVERLDAFRSCWEKVDLVKLDVEGAELMVLRGGRETVERWKPPVWMENLESHAKMFNYGKEEPIEWLKRRGYKTFERRPPDVWAAA